MKGEHELFVPVYWRTHRPEVAEYVSRCMKVAVERGESRREWVKFLRECYTVDYKKLGRERYGVEDDDGVASQ